MSNREDDFEIETAGFNVPNAPAPKPKQEEDLPDWAKITSNIAEEEELEQDQAKDSTSIEREYVPPMGKFGSSIEELSDDELFVPEEETQAVYENETAPQPSNFAEETSNSGGQVQIEKVSRSIEDEPEEEELEEKSKTEPVGKISSPKNRISLAKPKQGKPAKQARKVKKAVLEGLDDTETEILAPRGRMAGNRWKLIGLRTAVWGTLGMVVLAGVFAIIGPRGPSLDNVTQQVLSNINRNNFPLEAGQQVAARFAKEYLAIPSPTSGKAEERRETLSNYIIGTGTEESRIINFSADREQRVIGEPILAMPAELVSDNHVVYTFAVQVFQPAAKETEELPAREATAPTWVYLAVPMAADEDGAIGVAGAPAFVPQPAIADRAESITFREDSDAARDSKSQIEKFMLHWAASDTISLKPYLVDNLSTPTAQAGLGGTLEFKSLTGYSVESLPKDFVQEEDAAPTCSAPEFEAPCRDAYIDVTWNFQGIEITQKYRLVVLFDGQNWRVLDIRGANFGRVGG